MFIDVMTEVRLFENNQMKNKVFDLVFHFFSQVILKWFPLRPLVLHETKETVIVLFNVV